MAHQVVNMTEVGMNVTDLHMLQHILMAHLIMVALLAHPQRTDRQTVELTGNLNVIHLLEKAEAEVIVN